MKPYYEDSHVTIYHGDCRTVLARDAAFRTGASTYDRWNGMLQEQGVPREHREHPTQKPEAVIRWALMQAPQDVKTVLDPFMGSGTTLVAAKRLGKTAIGIEREERYCEIAARRCAQGSLDLSWQEPEAGSGGDVEGAGLFDVTP